VIAGLWPRFGKLWIKDFGRYRFIIAWLLGTILLLSIIPEKKERYLLPASVPMAILAGCLWRSLLAGVSLHQTQRGLNRFLKSHAIVLLMVSMAAIFLLIRMEMTASEPHLLLLLMQVIIFISLIMISYRLFKRPKAATLFMATLVVSSALTLIIIPSIATSPLFIVNQHYQSLDEARELVPLQTYDIYQAGRVNMKDVWKVGKPIRPWSEIQKKLGALPAPVVLMSEGNPEKQLPKRIKKQIQVENLGCFRSDYRQADKTKCFTLITPAGQGQ
jgi:4-amino-4-deoxy-L-arabinose transferase-like glycosyltransferase